MFTLTSSTKNSGGDEKSGEGGQGEDLVQDAESDLQVVGVSGARCHTGGFLCCIQYGVCVGGGELQPGGIECVLDVTPQG